MRGSTRSEMASVTGGTTGGDLGEEGGDGTVAVIELVCDACFPVVFAASKPALRINCSR